MTEVTINIPAEHVETVRSHLRMSIGAVAEPLDSIYNGTPESMRTAVAKMQALADVMEQIGWEGDGERTLTADRELLAEPIGHALEYARDDIGGNWVDRSKLPELMERVRWLSETLDSFEPEKVGAA